MSATLAKRREAMVLQENDDWIKQTAFLALARVFPPSVVQDKLQDATQEARIAFLKCYRTYTTKGLEDAVALQTYARLRVRGAALDFARGRRSKFGAVYCGADDLVCNPMDTYEQRLDAAMLMADLSKQEREVVVLCDVAGMTLKEVGEYYGVTEGRICQLRGKAMRSMRDRYNG